MRYLGRDKYGIYVLYGVKNPANIVDDIPFPYEADSATAKSGPSHKSNSPPKRRGAAKRQSKQVSEGHTGHKPQKHPRN